MVRRSNGKRFIELHCVDSVDLEGPTNIVPIAPVANQTPTSMDDVDRGAGTDSSFGEGKYCVRLYTGHRSGALPRTPSST